MTTNELNPKASLPNLEESFTVVFNALSDVVYADNTAKGFWDNKESQNQGEKIALMHSELSEALEAVRKNLMDDKLVHRSGVEVELADTVIRIMDFAGGYNLDVGGAIIEKLAYNRTRPYKHGKKF